MSPVDGTIEGMAAELAPLTVIYGTQPLLVEREISAIIGRIKKIHPAIDRREAVATGLSAADFADMVAPSLFAQPRLIIVHGAQLTAKSLQKSIVSYLGAPLPDVYVIIHDGAKTKKSAFTGALVKAHAALIECPLITRDADRLAFLRKEVTAAGGSATPEALTALLAGVGEDLAELASAAAQIVSDTAGTVDEAAVLRYHRGRAAVTGYTIADLAVVGNISGALEALRWAFAVGVPLVLIADALADGVRTIGKVAGAGARQPQQIAAELGMPPWKIDKARRLLRGWNATGVATALAAVTQLNADIKGYAADPHYAVERAVIAVGQAQRMS